MAKLPFPHSPIAKPGPDEERVLPKETRLWRIYAAEGRHGGTWNGFRAFGPLLTGRFDHHRPPPHDDPEIAILYAALDAPTAIVEAFQHDRLIDRAARRPWLVGFDLTRPLRLLDLTGAWPTRAGASQAIATGRRDVTRTWSRAIHAETSVAGLTYRAAMGAGGESVALYERARNAMPAAPAIHVPLDHPGLEIVLARVATTFGYDIR